MEQANNLIKRNILWVVIGMLVLAFAAISIQSKSESEELNSAFVSVSQETNMYKGDSEAPVDVVIYTDFLCPYCADFATDVMPLIEKEYVETGKAKVEVRPVAMIGLDSDLAAEAAYCAADQRQFWTFHDTLYDYAEAEISGSGASIREESVLTEPILTNLMKNTKEFDEKQFSSCVADESYADAVTAVTADATANGVSGTPHVMVNGNHIQGLSYEIVSSVIKAQL